MSPKKVRIKHLIPLLISFKKCMKFWYDKTYEKYDLLPFHILFIQTFRSFFQDRHIQCQSSPKRIIKNKKLEILETYLEKTPIIYSPYLKNKNEEEIIADGQIGIWQDLHEINYICQLYCQRYQKACSNNRRGTFPCSSFRKFDIESLGLWWSRGIHGKLFRITARKYFQVLLFLKKFVIQ